MVFDPLYFKFTKRELKDFAYSIFFISLIFSIASGGDYIVSFIISLVLVGLSFLLHELGHKFVAQHYGFHAEYVADRKNVVWPIIFALFGFVFIAPGAVHIKGYIQKRENAMIAMAGPIMNIIQAIIFLLLPSILIFGYDISRFGFVINSTLAVFNLIPVSIFDGKKIFMYNKKVYYVLIGVSLLLYFLF